MKDRRDRGFGLTDFQWFAILFCAILGSGVITLPRVVAEIAGRDGWLSILSAGAITWVLAILVWLLCKKFPDKTLPEFSITILGKPLGILVSLAYVFYTIGIAGITIRLFVELTKTWVFIWTPEPVFILAILLPVVYISRMGAASLGRFAEIITQLTVLVFIVWLVPMGKFSSLNLRPVGTEGVAAIAGASPRAALSFLGFEVMLVFFPFIKSRKKVLRITLIALTIITLLYAANAVMIFGVLGVEQTVMQKWPLMNYLRIGILPFIQRIDSLLLFLWTAQIVSEATIQYFAGTFTLATLTKHHYHDIWAIVCWPLVYLVAIAPQSLAQIITYSGVISEWAIIGITGIVLLLLLVAKIRGLDESKIEEEKA